MLMSERLPFTKPTWLVLLPASVLPVKLTYSTCVVRGMNFMFAPVSIQSCIARKASVCCGFVNFEMSYGITPSGQGCGLCEVESMCAGSGSAANTVQCKAHNITSKPGQRQSGKNRFMKTPRRNNSYAFSNRLGAV